MRKFDTPSPISTILDIPAGRVQFIAADRADTAVEVLPADASKSRDVKLAERITVEYGDGVLRIETPAPKNRILGSSGSIEVTVQLPAGSGIEAKAASAEFRGVGRLGDVAFEAAQSSIKLDERAPASPSKPGTSRSVAWAALRRSAPQRATSTSPRPCAARRAACRGDGQRWVSQEWPG
jgi:hypothetical protein